MTDELEPDVVFARFWIITALVTWCVALGLTFVMVGTELVTPAHGHSHVELPLLLSAICAIAIALLIRALGKRPLATAAAAVLTTVMGFFTLLVAMGFVLLPVGLALLAALPQVSRHAAWRRRQPTLPRARVVR